MSHSVTTVAQSGNVAAQPSNVNVRRTVPAELHVPGRLAAPDSTASGAVSSGAVPSIAVPSSTEACYSTQLAWGIGVLLVLFLGVARLAIQSALSGTADGEAAVPIADAGFRVDLNTATVAELRSLPDFGATLATRIVEYRNTHGKFASVQELGRVHGVGPKTLARLKAMLFVNPMPNDNADSTELKDE